MNAIQFIKDHGVEKARNVVGGAPTRANWYQAKGKYSNDLYSCNHELHGEAIMLSDLKRLVDSVDYVNIHGYEKSKEILANAPEGAECYSWTLGNSGVRDKTVELVKLKQALTDWESIYV